MRSRPLSLLGLAALALALFAIGGKARAGEPMPDPAAATFFEKKVRPILVARCHECHGPESKARGGLRVDSREALLRGGDRGPVLTPGKPEDSLLVHAINHDDNLKMPPKNKLPPQEIADLTAWVKMGAPWPNVPATAGAATGGADGRPFTEEEKSFWAFRPPATPPLPEVRDTHWPRSPLDRFILAGLEAQGLHPAPPADKHTLIRRATFDLIGLPPTPEEVADFLADDSPGAFARVVDRLLASPHYGERWGRHWLDIARYADSNGMDENLVYGNAWRYRDYVIRSFNDDKPYDRFVREQLAADLLPGDAAAAPERLVATGFLTLGPKMLAEDDPVKMEMDIVDEQVDTTGKAFLGLTLGCARCHDHKFDPVPTADYYSLAGVFKSTKTMDNFRVVARWHERPLPNRAALARQQEHQKKIDAKRAEIAKAAGDAAVLKRLQGELGALEKAKPELPAAMAVTEGTPGNLRIHLRGNHLTLGHEVPRRFPRILAGEKQSSIDGKQSGRLQVAEWLTRRDNPLTARVLVNRLWHWHFGAGLVRSPDNFGALGDRPINQQLLDWLAVRFVESGWSLKAMHRLILLSSTYQMSGAYDERAALVDPEDRLHWRWQRRRLDAEEVRDALLAVSGQLDSAMGGSLMQGGNRGYVPGYPNSSYDNYESRRRSVYLPVIRSDLYRVFQAFDFADPSTPSGERPTTTVAPQALFMMNSKLVLEQTRHLATDLLDRGDCDDAGRVRLAYERAYGRLPTTAETARALGFVRRVEGLLEGEKVAPAERRLRAWQSLCRVIVAANEFIYVE
jgi:cytochrome c553